MILINVKRLRAFTPFTGAQEHNERLIKFWIDEHGDIKKAIQLDESNLCFSICRWMDNRILFNVITTCNLLHFFTYNIVRRV